MRKSTRLAGALIWVAGAGALLAACSGSPSATAESGPAATVASNRSPTPSASASAAASAPASPSASPTGPPVYPLGEAAPGTPPQAVRDSFAVLQATYTGGCGTTGAQCAYFLNRLLTNLDELQRSMRAAPQGPAHFRAPLAWIAAMQKRLGADFGYANLKAHQKDLIATRDRINAWMQHHPEDYR